VALTAMPVPIPFLAPADCRLRAKGRAELCPHCGELLRVPDEKRDNPFPPPP